MNGERIKFDADKQRINDLLRTIDTIEPVIDVIRSIYNSKARQEEIHEEGIEKNGKIEAYTEIIDSSSNEALKQELAVQKAKLEDEVQKGIWEYNDLENMIEELMEELEEYRQYILSFSDLTTEDAQDVLYNLDNENDRKMFSALLLFTNENIEDGDMLDLLCCILVDEEIKNVIINLYSDEDALIEYIGTTAC